VFAADSKLDVRVQVWCGRAVCAPFDMLPFATRHSDRAKSGKAFSDETRKKTTDNTLTHMQHSCLHGGNIKIKICIFIFIIFIECQDN